MRFTPLSDQEADAQESGLWPEGEYSYEIQDAEETLSAAGNESIKLTVRLSNDFGEHTMVWNYLTNTPKAAWRIKQFAASCGMLSQYESGMLVAPEIINRRGMCKIGIQKSEGYRDKNVVVAWLKGTATPIASNPVRKSVPLAKAKVPASDLDDDSIPF